MRIVQIFEELARDHQKMKTFMARIADDDESEVRPALWSDLKRLLFAHAKAEEAVFYPNLIDDERAHLQAHAALRDHQEIEKLALAIDEMGLEGEIWRPLFRQLRTRLERHIEEEELDLFRLSRRHVSRDEAEEMGEIFRDMKSEVYEELSAI